MFLKKGPIVGITVGQLKIQVGKKMSSPDKYSWWKIRDYFFIFIVTIEQQWKVKIWNFRNKFGENELNFYKIPPKKITFFIWIIFPILIEEKKNDKDNLAFAQENSIDFGWKDEISKWIERKQLNIFLTNMTIILKNWY